MKYCTILLLFISVLFLYACNSTSEFPASEQVPAARITAEHGLDDNGNFKLQLKTQYLAHPERLYPPKTSYVVWAETADNGVVNLGQVQSKSGEKGELTTATPFVVTSLFITAEDDARVKFPSGVEISRIAIE